MDLKFFFWNICGKNAKDDLVRVGPHMKNYMDGLNPNEKPNIIAFAENLMEEVDVKTLIGNEYSLINNFIRAIGKGNAAKDQKYISIYADNKNYKLYPATFPRTNHMQLCNLEINGKLILLGCVHLVSKFKRDLEEIYGHAKDYKIEFERREFKENTNYDGSIVFGDFNSNPFERAMTKHDAWHAINIDHEDSSLAGKRYFINPMASLVGTFIYGHDHSKPPGTYFNLPNKYKENDIHWNLLDGCIYRPILHGNFSKKDFQIIIRMGTKDLFANNVIDSSVSDHLPITFKFKF